MVDAWIKVNSKDNVSNLEIPISIAHKLSYRFESYPDYKKESIPSGPWEIKPGGIKKLKLNKVNMKRLLISLLCLIGAIALIIFAPPVVMYAIGGWQLGTWASDISRKLSE